MASRRPDYLGEPTLGQVMRRPQWILALLLAIAIAGAFAWLGRWQASHAFRADIDELTQTETVRPLDELAGPTAGVPEKAAGAVVSLDGSLVAGDFLVVSERMNRGSGGERERGSWVVGHLVRGDGASLAVAVGWAPGDEAAHAAIERLDERLGATPDGRLEVFGRYLPTEAPGIPRPSDDPHRIRTMAPAQLANAWNTAPIGPIYGGYLVLHDAGAEIVSLLDDARLDAIDSVPPSPPERVNWLNVFYAIEWVVFGVVALLLWYRLARDAWEKEHELKKLLAESSVEPDPPSRQAR